jgi:hypothetical protein
MQGKGILPRAPDVAASNRTPHIEYQGRDLLAWVDRAEAD